MFCYSDLGGQIINIIACRAGPARLRFLLFTPMREVIARILAAEEEGAGLTAAAHARAAITVSSAKKRASALLPAALERAREEAAKISAAAMEAAARERAALLEAALAEAGGAFSLDRSARSRAAANVARRVLGL